MQQTISRLASCLAVAALLGGGLEAMAGTIGTTGDPAFSGTITKECTLTISSGGVGSLVQNNLVLASGNAVQVSATSNLIDQSGTAPAVVFSLPDDLQRSGGYGTAVPANSKKIVVGGTGYAAAHAVDLAADGSLASTNLGVEFTLTGSSRWPAGEYATNAAVTCTDNGTI